jgi:hypothetical protein
METAKLQIEQRYRRLSQGQRRPSMEYVTPSEIRELFLPHAASPEAFAKLSDAALLDIYDQWYHGYFAPGVVKKANEMSLPEIEDFIVSFEDLIGE